VESKKILSAGESDFLKLSEAEFAMSFECIIY